MLVERRLREGMQRNAQVLDPDVDHLLPGVMRQSRRRVATRRGAIVGAGVAALVFAIVIGPRVVDALRTSEHRVPASTPTPSLSNTQALTGSFARRLDANSPGAQENEMAGEWTIELHADGTMNIVAPPRFAGVLSAVQFQVTGNRFRTDLFVQDVCTNLPLGSYRWSRSGGTLTFKVIDDACEARVALFTSHSWTGAS